MSPDLANMARAVWLQALYLRAVYFVGGVFIPIVLPVRLLGRARFRDVILRGSVTVQNASLGELK